MVSNECGICGKQYVGKPTSRFCSRECLYQSFRVEKKIYNCEFCKKEFKPKASNRIKYCSIDCYQTDREKRKKEREKTNELLKFFKCKICGAVIIGKYGAYCSDICRKENARRTTFETNKNKKSTKKKCVICGDMFVSEYGDKRRSYCSIKCSKKASPSGNMRKRAKYYGVKYQYINPLKVFARDGWLCQMCGKKTPMNRRGSLMSNAPELDHRIPISKGGPHVYSNLQCLCRACNARKSNKYIPSQLPLFEVKSL
jgi:hypothetical protein